MKKIGLHGSYFGRNFGDTLILSIIKNWIEENSEDIEVFLPFVSTKQESIEIIGKYRESVDFKELDGLIFGPGGYFGEPSVNYLRKIRWSYRNYKRHIKWNDELYKNNIPYAIVGVGVGPITFKIFRRHIVKLFKNAKYISVRDKYSKEYLVKWGVDSKDIFLVSDVALTLSPIPSRKNKTTKVALHFPIKHLKENNKIEEFISFIEYISKDNDIYLLEDGMRQFNNSNPNNLKNILLSHNLDLPVVNYMNPDKVIKDLSTFDKVITSKLHIGIVSYALGKRVLSIPMHPKTFRFYEQIDRSQFCLEPSRVTTQNLIDKFYALDQIDNMENIQFQNAIRNKNIINEFLNAIN